MISLCHSGVDLAVTWDSGHLELWLTWLFVHLWSPWWALGPAGSLFVPEIQVMTANATSSTDSPKWEMLSPSSFFKTWKVLECCVAFRVCDIGHETQFPRKTGTFIKWVGHTTGWETPQLHAAENQGGSKNPGTSQRSCVGLTQLSSSGLCSHPTGRGSEPHREREV